MYILDTDVISRTSPLSLGGGPGFTDWLRGIGNDSYLSVVTIGELRYGYAQLVQRGATRRAEALDAWIRRIVSTFSERLLIADHDIAIRAGDMLARAEKAGFDPGFEDAYIAATGAVHGLKVVTYNAIDFRALGADFEVPKIGPTT